MVAVTIILAAVIGTFLMGLTPEEERASMMSVTVQGHAGPDNVTLAHNGGDPLKLDEVTVVVDGATTDNTTGLSGTLAPGERQLIQGIGTTGETTVAIRHDPSGEIVAEDTVTVD